MIVQDREAHLRALQSNRYAKLLKQLARAKLLVLDDWGPEPLTSEQARDLLKSVEDRYDAGLPSQTVVI